MLAVSPAAAAAAEEAAPPPAPIPPSSSVVSQACVVLQHHGAEVYDDTSQHTARYGESIATDPFLGPMISREHYFLNKLIPRQENIASILRATCSVWTLSDTACVVFLFSVFGVTTGVCSGTYDNALIWV